MIQGPRLFGDEQKVEPFGNRATVYLEMEKVLGNL